MKNTFYIILILILFASCNQIAKTDTEAIEDITEMIILPEQSQCVILLSDSIIPENAFVFLDASGRACLLIDSVVFYLETENTDNEQEPMLFFNSTMPRKVCCFNDGTILFNENNFLNQIKDGESKTLITFPTDDFHLEKAGEEGVYVSFFDKSEKQYHLILVNKNTMIAHKLLSDSLPIIVAGFGEMTAVAIDRSVYLLYEGESKHIFQAQEPITHLAFAPNGFFYATENNVGYFDSEINIIFLKRTVRNMFSFDNKLYLLLKEGSLYKITNTEYFNELSNI